MIKKEIDNFSHFKEKIDFISDSEIKFVGNEELLSTALSNLLTNAIKYAETERIDVILFEQDGKICLQVKDYGVGIPSEHISHIFEKFYRIDKSRSRKKGGTGLGLAIVKNIVELHNGTVYAESENGKGSVFTIKFN